MKTEVIEIYRENTRIIAEICNRVIDSNVLNFWVNVWLVVQTFWITNKTFWLTQDQYELFVDFDKYIQDTGSTKDYPHLFVNCGESLPRARESAEDGGELATVAANELSAEPINLDTDPFTETFSTGFASPRADELLAQQITENAKHRATSILMAESAIANHYLQNPDLLDPEFRAQINSISIPKIDPKGLAASLIRGVKMNIGAA